MDARELRPAAVLPGDDPSQPPVLGAGSAPVVEAPAAATGGVAAAGTNDLRAPLRQAVEDAAAYYLLSDSPRNTHWDGRFLRIEIRVKRPGVQVQARSGYFALPPACRRCCSLMKSRCCGR
ncbi:MAG: hypothetical protein KatS3mg004_2823 [Bryobacteraceae bacterium]|nr:MAG: hypothetical protein KatS3mg004_2823 [Bryobacteraceae bacterium]